MYMYMYMHKGSCTHVKLHVEKHTNCILLSCVATCIPNILRYYNNIMMLELVQIHVHVPSHLNKSAGIDNSGL